MLGKFGTYETNGTVTRELFLKTYDHPGIREIWCKILEKKADTNDIVAILGGGDQVKASGEDAYFLGGMTNEEIAQTTLVLSVLQKNAETFPDYVSAAISNMETHAETIEKRGFAMALLGKKNVTKKIETTLTTEAECKSFASGLKDFLTTEVQIDPVVAESTVIQKVTSHLSAVSNFKATTEMGTRASQFKVVMSKQEGKTLSLSMYDFEFNSDVKVTKNAGIFLTENKVSGDFTVSCKTASFALVPST